ncbi:MAG: YceI family protein [Bacteroidales bacterium]|nr:YceI family protein [Bacteroidales bacterium]
MRNIFSAMAVLIFCSAHPVLAQTIWTVDNAHSKIGFTVTHLVVAEVDGSFKEYNGQIVTTQPDFSDAKIEFTVNVASIFTANEMRDNHLKGDDFFNAGKYPEMTFKSTSFNKTNDSKYVLEGSLTIRGITKNVSFDVTYGGMIKDPLGNTKTGFKATTTIDRFDYDLKWNSLTEAGGAVVGRDVKIILKLEFQKQ